MTSNETPTPDKGRDPGRNRSADPSRTEPGYRGSLPSREDRLARPWIFAIIGIFLLVIVLSIAGIPSRFIPDPTAPPLPSLPPASVPASVEASPSGSVEASPSAVEPSPSGSVLASPRRRVAIWPGVASGGEWPPEEICRSIAALVA